ncbi:MAG: c-type cytochrome [Verrucomicrobiaceae bacterium]
MKRFFFLLPFLLNPASAVEDGKVLYTQFCSACHGTDGVGPEGNLNPPLAKSEWLLGKPDRAISAVLAGLKGPIEVNGRLYNLAMPPQGAVINDEQLAAILTYVRKSWGNKGSAVKAEQVGKVRGELAERIEKMEYFTADELRRKHPIEFGQGWPRLRNLTSSVYHGKWEVMPDFSKLEVVSVEEEPRNLVDVAHGNREKEFGIVWEGEIVTAKEGDYNAMLDASDGAALYINGRKIVEVEGVGPRGSERARIQRFRMLEGANQFRLEYFNNQGDPGLSFQMSGPTGKPWLSESRLEITPSEPAIMLVAPEEGAILYRNFIAGAQPKAIGVGLDGGVNQAFSIVHLGLDLVWQGDFIDGGKHWTNRGTGFQKPAGTEVVRLLNRPAFGRLSDETGVEMDFGGYSLDAKGIPTFRYEVAGVKVFEKSTFAEKSGRRELVREIVFELGDAVPEGLHLALAAGPKVEAVPEGYLLDGKVTLSTSSDGGLEPIMRGEKDGPLVVPLKLKAERTTLTVTYTFPKS